ncbi:peptidase, partial [Streptomyces sp. SID4956]|nr:peptidase [Streptomyces sp. SID4956]
MDVSGGRGQPQPGNDESAEHTGPEAQTPGGTGDAPTTPSAPTPADAQDARPEGPESG